MGAYIERYAMHAGDEREDAGEANSRPVERAKQARQQDRQDERDERDERGAYGSLFYLSFQIVRFANLACVKITLFHACKGASPRRA